MAGQIRIAAWGLWAFALSLSIAARVLAALNRDLPGTLRVVVGITVPFATVGALIASRRPQNPIGWLFCVIGLLQGVNVSASEYATYALLTADDPLPGGAFMTVVAEVTWFPALALLSTFVLLHFPTGHLPSKRWRIVGWTAAVGLGVAMTGWVVCTWPDRGVGLLASEVPPVLLLRRTDPTRVSSGAERER